MAGLTQSISLASKYLPMMDEVYKQAAKTSIFDDIAPEFVGANAVKIFKLSTDGLADYSKSTGYVSGGIVGAWETLTMSKDRGVSLHCDRFDNEETLNMVMGNLLGTFVRTQVAPELDAYRFSKWASWTGAQTASAAITPGTTDVPGLIDAAEKALSDEEVPEEGRVLFVSENTYAGLKAKINRTLANENGVSRMIETYDGMPVIRVPQPRFYTAITLNDGTSDFGFAPTAGGYKINFMMVHPTAVKNVVKQAMPKIFSPDENQTADNWLLQYRLYHDTFALDNKVKGIYMHRDTTAVTADS